MIHQLHLHYPNSGILLTSIPKNGCTSLKNYFLDIELAYSGSDLNQREYGFQGMSIHAKRNRFRARSGPKKRDGISVLVLRNPYSRVASAWVNKFLYAQADYAIVNRHRDQPFARLGEMAPEDIRQAFREFVVELNSSDDFRESDNHWRPQSQFYRNLTDYSIVLETTEVIKLPTLLADQGVDEQALNSCVLMHFNRSDSTIYEILWSPGTTELVEAAYAEDFLALKAAGIPVTKPVEKSDDETPKSLSPEDIQKILESRLRSADQHLEVTYASKSWRWTKPLRRLASAFEEIRWRIAGK